MVFPVACTGRVGHRTSSLLKSRRPSPAYGRSHQLARRSNIVRIAILPARAYRVAPWTSIIIRKPTRLSEDLSPRRQSERSRTTRIPKDGSARGVPRSRVVAQSACMMQGSGKTWLTSSCATTHSCLLLCGIFSLNRVGFLSLLGPRRKRGSEARFWSRCDIKHMQTNVDYWSAWK